MRARTFVLFFLILLLVAAGVVAYLIMGDDGNLAGLLGGNDESTTTEPVDEGDEPGQPRPTATPEYDLVPVVVTTLDMPAGTRIERDFLTIVERPDDNVAVRAGYAFSDPEEIVGRITRTQIDKGQEVLDAMLALSVADLASMGSDLSLYVTQNNVALAFPIDRYTGAAYAMRPGDAVDVLATVGVIDIDPEFRTALPNILRLVSRNRLAEGGEFLFPEAVSGRLEVLPGANVVATIGPRGISSWSGDSAEELLQIPRRVTQLTIQQAEVLWVGTWNDPGDLTPVDVAAETGDVDEAPPAVRPTATAVYERTVRYPDVVILNMSLQDALTLKWAMDRGVRMDLALRAQGDISDHTTVSISLPQLVEQGGLTVPEPLEFDFIPRAGQVPPPQLPEEEPAPATTP